MAVKEMRPSEKGRGLPKGFSKNSTVIETAQHAVKRAMDSLDDFQKNDDIRDARQ